MHGTPLPTRPLETTWFRGVNRLVLGDIIASLRTLAQNAQAAQHEAKQSGDTHSERYYEGRCAAFRVAARETLKAFRQMFPAALVKPRVAPRRG